jgi:hypothetical protein
LADPIKELQKELSDYGGEVLFALAEVTKEVGAEAAQRLKTTSPKSKGKSSYKGGHYATKWTTESDRSGKTDTSTVVYNKKPTYRLAHLLEHGYVARNGKRVPGQEHIAPVDSWAQEEVVKALERKLKG